MAPHRLLWDYILCIRGILRLNGHYHGHRNLDTKKKRLTLDLDPSLQQRLKAVATLRGTSMRQYRQAAIEKELAKDSLSGAGQQDAAYDAHYLALANTMDCELWTAGQMVDAVNNTPLLSSLEWVSLRSWYQTHGRHHLPWRHLATPWHVFLAETLLHRTRAEAVEAIYPRIVHEFPSPAVVVHEAPRWIEMTRSTGLSWRAEAFISACRSVLAQYEGRVPDRWDALMTLPGVGHYVASAVRCFGFGIRGVIVDSNTIRLAARISGEVLDISHHRSQKVRAMVARLSEDFNPPGPDDNYALLDLAAKICRTGKPQCAECPIQPGCATGRLAFPRTVMEPRRRTQ